MIGGILFFFHASPLAVARPRRFFQAPCDPSELMGNITALAAVLSVAVLLGTLTGGFRHPEKICRRWRLGVAMAALALLIAFHFCLHQSFFAAILWSMGLFLTGLFPFQIFMPAVWGHSGCRAMACHCLGLRALGLFLLFLWLHMPEARGPAVMNVFHLFPVVSVVLGSVLALQAGRFSYFFACNDAFVSGFLVLNTAAFPLLPLPGFGSAALATALILFLASGVGEGEAMAQGESDFFALFHTHPGLAFAWAVAFLSLGGIFPIGHAPRWKLFWGFYQNHHYRTLCCLLFAILVASCASFRWIHAAIKYPHASAKCLTFRYGRAAVMLSVVLATLLCLSWFLPFYGL